MSKKTKYSNVISFETGRPFQKGYEPLPEIWIGLLPEFRRLARESKRTFKLKLVSIPKDDE